MRRRRIRGRTGRIYRGRRRRRRVWRRRKRKMKRIPPRIFLP